MTATTVGARLDTERLTEVVADLVARTVAYRGLFEAFVRGEAPLADCDDVTAAWTDAAEQYAQLVNPSDGVGSTYPVMRVLIDAFFGRAPEKSSSAREAGAR